VFINCALVLDFISLCSFLDLCGMVTECSQLYGSGYFLVERGLMETLLSQCGLCSQLFPPFQNSLYCVSSCFGHNVLETYACLYMRMFYNPSWEEGFMLASRNLKYKSKFFSPTDAQVNCLKNNFKICIKIYIKTAPTCFDVITIIRECTIWAC